MTMAAVRVIMFMRVAVVVGMAMGVVMPVV